MPAIDIQALESTFRGEFFRPGDAGYDQARRIWNASIDRRPAVIARCSGIADIVSAINFAREKSLLTAIRGGGHNVGGRALCDDGIVIDLSRMRSIQVDPANRTVRVQGGATLADLDNETHAFGLAVPSGVVSKTGIAGLTLGGGVGWLIRKYGMSIDNLLSCQVVTADGKILDAGSSKNDDLFWALRGGGGNFGVVASFEFRAHPVNTVIGGMLVYPRAAAHDVIRNLRDRMQSAPDELTAFAALLNGPDGSPVVGVIACYCGPEEDAERTLAPIRGFGSPVMDAIQRMPFPAMQSMIAPSFPDDNHNYWKSSMLRELPDEAVSTVIERANRMTSPLSMIVIEHYGGAAGRVASDATAFAHRDLPWDIVIAAQWKDPAESPRHRDWARDTEQVLQPFAARAHLLGALDAESQEIINTAFGANLPRLAAIKSKYDPTNFFRVNQNIRPAMAQTAAR
jgi:FAD/FMN-containing dehydrogenase